MANEVRIDLNLKGEQQTKRGLKETGDAAEKAGDKLKDMGEDAGFLAQKADEAERQLKELIRTLDQTGDTDLLKDIRKQRRQVRLFENLQKELMPQAEDAGAKIGATLGVSTARGLSASLKTSSPQVIAGLAVLAADMAPFLGAATSAAIVGGVGVGGIVGGLALAAQDQEVQTKAGEVGAAIASAFTVSAEPFTVAAIEGLDSLQQAGTRAAATMAPAFEALAPSVSTLADGIGGLVDKALPGLVRGMERAEPVINVISDELPEIGEAVGDFIDTVSQDTDGAVLAFANISEILQSVIRGTGDFISALSSAYEWSVRTSASVSGALEDVYGWIPIVGDMASASFANTNDRAENLLASLERADRAGGSFASTTEQMTLVTYEWGVATEATAEALTAQRAALDALVTTELAAIDATIGVERAIDSFSEAVAENGQTLDITNEKGRQNTETVTRGIEAVMRGAEEERKLALQHGATAAEAEAAAKKYRDEYGGALKAAAIAAFGNTAALKALLDELDKLDGKRVTYTIVRRGGVTIGARVDGGIILAGNERASGGPVRPGQAYVVGENGPEILQMGSQAGHVFNAGQTQQMLSGMSGGAMGAMAMAPQVIELRATGFHSGLERVFLSWLQEALRANPGVRLTTT